MREWSGGANSIQKLISHILLCEGQKDTLAQGKVMKNKGRPIPITLILHRASKWLIRLKTAIIQALTLSDDDARDAHEPNIYLTVDLPPNLGCLP